MASPTDPVFAIVVSSRDRRMIMLRDGLLVAEGPLVTDDAPFGSHVFTLVGGDAGGLQWSAVSYGAAGSDLQPKSELLARISSDPRFAALARDAMHPGMLLVLTDLPLTPDSRTGQDFVILD